MSHLQRNDFHMAKKKQTNDNIKDKLFSIKTLSDSKIKFLQSKLHSLTFQEVTWLSRIEDFYNEKEYLTEKQIEVLNSLVNKHSLNEATQLQLI